MDLFWMKSCEMKLHSTAKKTSLTLMLYLCVLELCYCYVNVALNKPTYQEFPYKSGDTYNSSNAVDGLKADLTWNGGQCVFSNFNRTATWWVNLTSIHSIHHITIYFMTDNTEWGCPTNGYYGINCSSPCPDINCQYCHIETGTCQGCKPKYRGHQCELDVFMAERDTDVKKTIVMWRKIYLRPRKLPENIPKNRLK